MAFKAKDGSAFTNRDSMKSHDMKSMAKSPAPQVEPQDSEESSEPEGAQDGAVMAQQHGPAAQIDIQHSEGAHTVHVMHPDGHSHESQHPTPEAAHKFAGDCAGCGGM